MGSIQGRVVGLVQRVDVGQIPVHLIRASTVAKTILEVFANTNIGGDDLLSSRREVNITPRASLSASNIKRSNLVLLSRGSRSLLRILNRLLGRLGDRQVGLQHAGVGLLDLVLDHVVGSNTGEEVTIKVILTHRGVHSTILLGRRVRLTSAVRSELERRDERVVELVGGTVDAQLPLRVGLTTVNRGQAAHVVLVRIHAAQSRQSEVGSHTLGEQRLVQVRNHIGRIRLLQLARNQVAAVVNVGTTNEQRVLLAQGVTRRVRVQEEVASSISDTLRGLEGLGRPVGARGLGLGLGRAVEVIQISDLSQDRRGHGLDRHAAGARADGDKTTSVTKAVNHLDANTHLAAHNLTGKVQKFGDIVANLLETGLDFLVGHAIIIEVSFRHFYLAVI